MKSLSKPDKNKEIPTKKTSKLQGISLNNKQEEAAQSPFGPMLVVAGAGTGKTKTLTSRLLYLLAQGAPPNSICAITFTNKAAREMSERVSRYAQLSGIVFSPGSFAAHTGLQNGFIGTFHSFGAKILRNEAGAFGRSPQFAIFDDSDSLQLVRKIIKSEKRSRPAPERGPAYFAGAISEIKNGVRDLSKIENSQDDEDALLHSAFRSYETRLAENNAFDFDDLIVKPVELFRTQPDTLEAYQRKFAHVLIDEYQDLNRAQYELVRLLAARATSLTAVGDDAQMIYGWRGSDIEIFLSFERDWPDARKFFLEQNYRSTGTILKAASAVIKNNILQSEERRARALWTENQEGSPITIAELFDEEAEAEWIAGRIARSNSAARYENGAETPDRENHKPSWAILYRTNAQSREIEQALIRHEIPYRIFGGLKFYERREIKDIVATLRCALNPRDEIGRDRILKTFTKRVVQELDNELALIKSAQNNPLHPAELIIKILAVTRYAEYLSKNFRDATERQENINSLVRFAGEFQNLSAMLEQIALLQADDAVRKDRAAALVTLATIHLAKGLEFDLVHIAGCADGLLPHARSFTSTRSLEEERRLMYVAMTRAKKNLSMSFCDLPSRFISELPPDTFEFESHTEDTSPLSDEERYITLD